SGGLFLFFETRRDGDVRGRGVRFNRQTLGRGRHDRRLLLLLGVPALHAPRQHAADAAAAAVRRLVGRRRFHGLGAFHAFVRRGGQERGALHFPALALHPLEI